MGIQAARSRIHDVTGEVVLITELAVRRRDGRMD
jgi:hypothetical protein